MQLEIWHLEGAERGRSQAFEGDSVLIGTDPSAGFRLESAPGVLPSHAQIIEEEGRVYLQPHGTVRVNGTPVGDVELCDGDLLELGDGVQLCIRLAHDPDAARDYREQVARAPLPASPSSPPVPTLHGRLGVVATLLVLAILVAGAYLATQPRRDRVQESLARERQRQDALRTAQQRAYEQRMRKLHSDMVDLEQRMADRDEVDERMGAVKRAVAAVESSVLRRVNTEIERSLGSNPDLRATRDAVRRIENADAAAERIITNYAGSVCLIQGSYGFGRMEGGEWRFLREASPELLNGVDLAGDKVPLMLDGDGPVFRVDYTGTGFLVDRKGIVMTNRHIAQPWWKNDAASPLLKDGYEARFIRLRAYFPGRTKALSFRESRTRIADDADLAVLFLEQTEGLPRPLSLADPAQLVPGRRVLLLGFPSGLDALLARTDEGFMEKMTVGGEIDPIQVLDALAQRKLVRPLPSQGHIGDVLEDRIVFDAPTAVGGSGGPLVDMDGRVLAVNYGILKAFRGANFGVPVTAAVDLLAKARASK